MYFTLAATIAHLLGLKSIRFYENGPVSLNLPISGQVVGGRATRTTHPQTLDYFQKLIRLIVNGDFTVENPFLHKTKSDIVRLVIAQNCGDLIKYSMSCAHAWQQDHLHHHCGTCSQCIDRRVAIIAADAQSFDEENDYLIDFFTEDVDKKKDDFEAENKNLLTSFFLRGDKIGADDYRMGKFEADFPALYDAILYMDGDPFNATKKIFTLYKSLAKDIQKVSKYATTEEFLARARSVRGKLPPGCLCNILLQSTRPVIEYRRIEPEPPAPYIFKKNCEIWKIRFAAGSVKMLIDSEGMFALKKLLSAPHHQFSLAELVLENAEIQPVTVDGDEIAEGFGSEDSYEAALDGKALRDCQKRYAEIKQELESAKDDNNNIRQAELEKEQQELSDYLTKNFKPNGKAKNLNKGTKKKIDRLTRNIRTIKEKLEQYCPELKEHLDQFLTIGRNPSYHPNSEIHWDTAEE